MVKVLGLTCAILLGGCMVVNEGDRQAIDVAAVIAQFINENGCTAHSEESETLVFTTLYLTRRMGAPAIRQPATLAGATAAVAASKATVERHERLFGWLLGLLPAEGWLGVIGTIIGGGAALWKSRKAQAAIEGTVEVGERVKDDYGAIVADVMSAAQDGKVTIPEIVAIVSKHKGSLGALVQLATSIKGTAAEVQAAFKNRPKS